MPVFKNPAAVAAAGEIAAVEAAPVTGRPPGRLLHALLCAWHRHPHAAHSASPCAADNLLSRPLKSCCVAVATVAMAIGF